MAEYTNPVDANLADREPKPAEYTDGPICSAEDAIVAIAKFLEDQGEGMFSMAFGKDGQGNGRWTVGLFFGREAPDSDMYAGAAYGMDKVAGAAVEACLREAGL